MSEDIKAAAQQDAQALYVTNLSLIDSWLLGTIELPNDEALNLLSQVTTVDLDSKNRRKAVTKKLGMSKPSTLDAALAKIRPPEQKTEELQGSEFDFPDVEPWDQPVDGGELLDSLAETFQRFVIFEFKKDSYALALWTVATYCTEKFDILPYLGVTSIAPECGKSTTLEILLYLCNRPVQSSNISGGVVYRVIEDWKPTLLIDEADTFLNSDKNEELLGIFNAGHKRAMAYVTRCVGEDHKPRRFNCFGPKAYGMIGRPPDTLLSRSIMVRLVRKNKDDVVEDLLLSERPELAQEFTDLKRKIKRWVNDHQDFIATLKLSEIGLTNRIRNNWSSLLKIAATASTSWAEKATTAAGATTQKRQSSDFVLLLRDIRNIFHTRKTDRIPSLVLVRDLLAQPASGWRRGINKRDEIDEFWLGKMMSEFDWETKPASLKPEQQAIFQTKRLARCYVLDERIKNLFSKFVTEPAEEVEISTIVPFDIGAGVQN
jgi:hypothetical protein